MSSVKVKKLKVGLTKKKLKKALGGSSDATQLFNQMISENGSDAEIIKANYTEAHLCAANVAKILINFAGDKSMLRGCNSELDEDLDTIYTFALDLRRAITVEPAADPKYEVLYTEFKDSAPVKTLIATCSNLVQYAMFLTPDEETNALPPTCDRFIITSVLPVKPFTFSEFDAKLLWSDDTFPKNLRRFVMNVISFVYIESKHMYDTIMKPDINLDSFCDHLQGNLGELRKRIPRCHDAFNIIANSLGLLKNNMPDYFRDYKSTGDSTIIMQNFISDVAKTSKGNIKVANQFNRILMHYEKMSKGMPKNAKIDGIFKDLQHKLTVFKEEERAKEKDADKEKDEKETETEKEETLRFCGTYDTLNNTLNYRTDTHFIEKPLEAHIKHFKGTYVMNASTLTWTENNVEQETPIENLPDYIKDIISSVE